MKTKQLSQNEKAQALLQLHTDAKILILPNIWNPIGALVLETKGYPAVATASEAVSASLGYRDGEVISKKTMLHELERICDSVTIPVTADIESGFATSLSELDETLHEVLNTGAVGINIQDSAVEGGPLRSIDEQCRRIAQIRTTADNRNIHLVINARIDAFISEEYSSHRKRLKDTIVRAAAYQEAGADSIYPMGPGDEATVKELRKKIALPLNIMVGPESANLKWLESSGINRVSYGPYIFRSCLQRFTEIADSLLEYGDFIYYGQKMMSGAEVEQFLELGYGERK